MKQLIFCMLMTVAVVSCGSKNNSQSEEENTTNSKTPLMLQERLVPEKKRLGEGELLYKGNAAFSQVQSFEVNFVLSADKSEIHNLEIILDGLNISVRHENMVIEQKGGKSTMTYQATYPVQNNKANLNLGNNGNLSLIFNNIGVTGTISYSYIIGRTAQHPDIVVDFGQSKIQFQPQRK